MSRSPVPDLSAVASPPRQSLSYEDLEIAEEPIGSGGQAIVYEATLTGCDEPRKVAFKEPKHEQTTTTEAVESFLKEATTWQTIDQRERKKPRWNDYEHIVGVIDTGEEPLPWIAMEYMDGGDLGNRLDNAPDGLPVNESLWMGECLCRGLEIAGEYGYSHLDVKPKNVLFRQTPEGTWDVPKLADWGVARALAVETGPMVKKTITYSAPEQFEPSKFGDPDSLTDLYQVGAVVYTMLTGEPPYTGSHTQVMREVVLGDGPTPPSQHRDELSEAIDVAVTQAMAKQKHDRYRGLQNFEKALRAIRTDGRLPEVIDNQIEPLAPGSKPLSNQKERAVPQKTENVISAHGADRPQPSTDAGINADNLIRIWEPDYTYPTVSYLAVLRTNAAEATVSAELDDLRKNFDYYDAHLASTLVEDEYNEIAAGEADRIIVSHWKTEETAETAFEFLEELPGVYWSKIDELIRIREPDYTYPTDSYLAVLRTNAAEATVSAELDDLRKNFDHYDAHLASTLVEDEYNEIAAGEADRIIVSHWKTEETAETAFEFLEELPGVYRSEIDNFQMVVSSEVRTGSASDVTRDDDENDEQSRQPQANAESYIESTRDAVDKKSERGSSQSKTITDDDLTDVDIETDITVVGCGNAGNNWIHKIDGDIHDATLVGVDTDVQQLVTIEADSKILMGQEKTQGRGAGSLPQVGEEAAFESQEEIYDAIEGSDMVFVTAGLGGGTGTGASPVVAETAQDTGALTVSVVTTPFSSEGEVHRSNAEAGLERLRDVSDTVILIPNDRSLDVGKLSWAELGEILLRPVEGITELLTKNGLVNLDFDGFQTVMERGDIAMVGPGDPALTPMESVKSALQSPFFGIATSEIDAALVVVTVSKAIGIEEVEEVIEKIHGWSGPHTRLVYGAFTDDSLDAGSIRTTIIATGVESPALYGSDD